MYAGKAEDTGRPTSVSAPTSTCGALGRHEQTDTLRELKLRTRGDDKEQRRWDGDLRGRRRGANSNGDRLQDAAQGIVVRHSIHDARTYDDNER